MLFRSANQCPQTGGRRVRIAPLWLPYQEAITYASDSIYLACGTGNRVSGTNQAAQTLLSTKVFPNPVQDAVHVELPAGLRGNWALAIATGRTVLDGTWQPNQSGFSIDLSAQRPGVYFLHLKAEDGSTSTHKLVISR